MCDIFELLCHDPPLLKIEYAYKELQWAWKLTLDMDVQDWDLLSRIHAELARLERPLRLHRKLQ